MSLNTGVLADQSGRHVSESTLTVMAIGVVAYAGQTIGHELLGHGGVCLLNGGQIIALNPLWMRCSIQSTEMVAAGPGFNLVAACAFGFVTTLPQRSVALWFFSWLSCAFNLLVALGYFAIGGLTTFGDWGALAVSLMWPWPWRIAAVVIGIGGYSFGIGILGRIYRRCAGSAAMTMAVLLKRALLPSIAAGLIAGTAECLGHGSSALELLLSLGSTVLVGASLLGIAEKTDFANPRMVAFKPILFDRLWIIAAAAAGVALLALGASS